MKKIILLLVIMLFASPLRSYSTPLLSNTDYKIDLLTAGVGAVTGITFTSTGDMFFNDYDGGRVLKIGASALSSGATPEVFATGISFPTDLAITSDGRYFVASSTSSNSNVLEIFADGSSSVFSTGFSFPTSIEAFGNELFVSNSLETSYSSQTVGMAQSQRSIVMG